MEIWIVWLLAYIVIGLTMSIMIEDMRIWDRLIFIVWPIPVGLYIVFFIYAIFKGCYVELKDYIKRNKR